MKLSIEVDESEFDRDIDRAFKKLANEVNLPGFRQGKAPRRVLEARIGVGPAREQALRDSIPQYLAKAVREHDVDLIATPEIELTGGTQDGPVAFDATCEVRPEVSVPGYGGLRIELPSPAATDDEVEEAVQNELRRHARLEPVDRPAARGDHLTLDIAGTRDGEPVAGLTADDWDYELGQGWVADDFDDQLIGVTAGDDLTFSTTPKGTEEPVDFAVKITAVNEQVLPELTDEWVSEHLGEFDSVEAWRAAIGEQMSAAKLAQARNLVIERTSEALANLVDIEPPESLVQSEVQARVENTVRQLQARGVSVEQWLSVTGQSPEAFMATMKEGAERAVKVDLALRAVAEAEGMTVTDDDLLAEYARVAVQVGQKPNQVKRAYERNDAVVDLSAQLRKSKALDWLLHHVEVVDPDGAPIDRDLLIGHTHDHEHDDHDHGHVHDHEPAERENDA